MTLLEAREAVHSFYALTNPTEDDRFLLVEALEYLIRETKDPQYIMMLGGIYYEERKFDLALKYYEMAAEYNDLNAIIGLGYIWYYVRTGEKNYEKAFYYYDRARQLGEPLPETFTRLAKIRSEEGNVTEALQLYDAAKDFLTKWRLFRRTERSSSALTTGGSGPSMTSSKRRSLVASSSPPAMKI